MQLQTNTQGEAMPKLRRTRKSDWRKHWFVLTQGATLEARAIRAIGPRGFANKANLPDPLRVNGRLTLVECRSQLKWEPPAVPRDAFGLAVAKAKSKHTQSKFRVLVGYEWRKVFSKECLCRVMKSIDYVQKHFGEVSAYEARNFVVGHPIAEFPPLAAVRQARVLRKLKT